MNEQERETNEILSNSSWRSEGIVKDAVLRWYYPTLQQDLIEKRQQYKVSDDETEAVKILERYDNNKNDVVYVDMSSEIMRPHFDKPEKMQKWPLDNEEIKVCFWTTPKSRYTYILQL